MLTVATTEICRARIAIVAVCFSEDAPRDCITRIFCAGISVVTCCVNSFQAQSAEALRLARARVSIVTGISSRKFEHTSHQAIAEFDRARVAVIFTRVVVFCVKTHASQAGVKSA